MFWNILDEKEFLDNSHHIGLDFPQGLPRHTFSQKSLFWAKTAQEKRLLDVLHRKEAKNN